MLATSAQTVFILFMNALLLVVAFKLLSGQINTRGLLEDKETGTFSPGRLQLLILTLGGASFYFFQIKELKMDSLKDYSLIKDILVIGIATVALILSLINTWHTMWRDKIKLRMHTVEVFDPTTGKKISKILAVNIVNLSYIAVTIDRVELFIEGANNKEEILSFSEVSKQLPKRLEPRSNEIVIFPQFVGVKNPNPLTKKATHVVAKTACGYTVRCKFNPSLYH